MRSKHDFSRLLYLVQRCRFRPCNLVDTSKSHASTPRYQALLCTVPYSIYAVRECRAGRCVRKEPFPPGVLHSNYPDPDPVPLYYCVAVMQVIMVFQFLGYKSVSYGDYTYPGWALAIGWCVAFISFSCIPIGIIHTLLQSKGNSFKEVHIVFYLSLFPFKYRVYGPF